MATLPNVTAIRQAPQSRRQIVSAQRSGIPQAIGQFAEAVGQVADTYEKERDAQAVFAARRQLDDWERKALFDPTDGAVNKRGADAFDVPKKLTEDFDRVAGEVSQGLSSERQRQAFRDVLESRRGQITSWADKHSQKEREVYDHGEYEADIKTMTDRAAMFPEKAAAEVDQIERRTIGYLRSKGRSEAEINATLADQRDRAHASVIASMLSSERDTEAAAYFDANKSRMSQGMRDTVGAQVQERSTLLNAQRNADELLKAGVSEKDALAQTRAKFQGKGEEVAAQQIRTRFAEAEAARLDRVREVSTSAWSVLMGKGSMSAIPPVLMAELRATAPEEERQMRDWLQAKAERAKSDAQGKEPKTDWPTYTRLRDSAVSNPEQFIQEDLGKYAPYIAGPQLEQLQDLKDRLANPKEAKESIGTQRRVLTAVRELRLTGKRNEEKRGKFESAVTDALDAAREAKGGKPLTADEVQKEIDRLMIPGEVESGSWWAADKNAFTFEISDDPDKMGRFVPTIPDADRARLMQKFQARGIAKPTEDQIMSAYKNLKGL